MEPVRDRAPITRIGIMMFFQYFIWGAWYATLGVVLTHHGLAPSIGAAYAAGPLASLLSPLLLGLVADRYFASQRVLAALHIVGAALLITLPGRIMASDEPGLILSIVAYMLCYMPTVGLTNNVAFHALAEAPTRFPTVRVFGTAGWIAAGSAIGLADLSASYGIFWIAAAASLVLAGYTLTMPDTPPPAAGRPFSWRDALFADSIALLRDPAFLTFCVCATLIAIPLAAYYAYAAAFLDAAHVPRIGAVMSLGQVSEVGFMLMIPWMFRRLGTKRMLLIGMLAWALRYVLFAIAARTSLVSLAYAGVLLHGVCYDFFFVVGFMYTDRVAGAAMKGQAQGFIVVLTYGLGMLLGSQLSGLAYAHVLGPAASISLASWGTFWLFPAVLAAAVAFLFYWKFSDPPSRSIGPPPDLMGGAREACDG